MQHPRAHPFPQSRPSSSSLDLLPSSTTATEPTRTRWIRTQRRRLHRRYLSRKEDPSESGTPSLDRFLLHRRRATSRRTAWRRRRSRLASEGEGSGRVSTGLLFRRPSELPSLEKVRFFVYYPESALSLSSQLTPDPLPLFFALSLMRDRPPTPSDPAGSFVLLLSSRSIEPLLPSTPTRSAKDPPLRIRDDHTLDHPPSPETSSFATLPPPPHSTINLPDSPTPPLRPFSRFPSLR